MAATTGTPRCTATGCSRALARLPGARLRAACARGARGEPHARERRGRGAPTRAAGRTGFERPYGLAWLLQLAPELRRVGARTTADAAAWVGRWLASRRGAAAPRLAHLAAPSCRARSGGRARSDGVRVGLALDWAAPRDAGTLEQTLLEGRRDYYAGGPHGPLAYEPSGHDFLSPCLAEADLMRRVLRRRSFGAVARRRFLPSPARSARRRGSPGRGDRSVRRQARPPGRPQPEPRVDAGGHRRGVAARDTRVPRSGPAAAVHRGPALAPSRARTTRAATGSAASRSIWSPDVGCRALGDQTPRPFVS